MKRIIVLFIAAVFISSCASIKEERHWQEAAREKSFTEIFPAYYSLHKFGGLEEASEFVNVARTKFAVTSGKERQAGLGARLFDANSIGSPVTIEAASANPETPVALFIFMDNIRYNNDWLNFRANDAPDEKILRAATTVSLSFLIFYEGRAAVLTSFYLDTSKYRTYSDNSQIKKFYFNGNEYEAQYPTGWNLRKVFQYLNKEID